MQGRRTARARGLTVALLLAATLTSGCEALFAGVQGDVPVVQLSDDKALLVEPPDLYALGAYFCDQLLGSLLCIPLGPPPRKEDLQFHFQLVFLLDNPNELPVPTTEIMVGLHLYPGQTFGELGKVCTTLCEAGATNCPIPPSGACVLREEDIDSVDEFLDNAVVGALELAADTLDGRPVEDHLGLYTIPAGGDLELKVTFSIGIDPMLRLLGETAEEYVEQLLSNQETQLDIPYAVGGRVWFDVPYLGRITVGFGPFGDAAEPLWWRVF